MDRKIVLLILIWWQIPLRIADSKAKNLEPPRLLRKQANKQYVYGGAVRIRWEVVLQRAVEGKIEIEKLRVN